RALGHEMRRTILGLLKFNSYSYTELMHMAQISSGKLNYHLQQIDDLVQKNGITGEYELTIKGIKTLEFMESMPKHLVEEETGDKIISIPPLLNLNFPKLVLVGVGIREREDIRQIQTERYETQQQAFSPSPFSPPPPGQSSARPQPELEIYDPHQILNGEIPLTRLNNSTGIVYLFNLTDEDRYQEYLDILHELLTCPALLDIPFMVDFMLDEAVWQFIGINIIYSNHLRLEKQMREPIQRISREDSTFPEKYLKKMKEHEEKVRKIDQRNIDKINSIHSQIIKSEKTFFPMYFGVSSRHKVSYDMSTVNLADVCLRHGRRISTPEKDNAIGQEISRNPLKILIGGISDTASIAYAMARGHLPPKEVFVPKVIDPQKYLGYIPFRRRIDKISVDMLPVKICSQHGVIIIL
ncbi:unnamed protein product, partial [marine sediment metagenome]